MIEQSLGIPAADGLTEALLIRPESNDPLPAVINLTDDVMVFARGAIANVQFPAVPAAVAP